MLADFDPYGISIMSTYKYGSHTLSHENEHLSIPSLRWLGIRSNDIRTSILHSTGHDNNGLLTLSTTDRRRAISMLLNNAALAENREADWRREMQLMLMLGVKAEMEIIERGDVDIAQWLADRLQPTVLQHSQGGLTERV